MTVRDERRHLARAIALAQGAVVRASPNPGVGCVLTRGGAPVGEGVTAPVGGPHAEVEALRAAGARARGATAYVTLEPCAHRGRTPPCTDALLAAGVTRVVIAHPDPHPVAAGGAVRLAAAGVDVLGPLPPGDPLREAVAGQLEGFLTGVRRGRPHVTLKLAQTVDGSLRAPEGARWLTGPTARRAVHRWRAARDAVLVGSGTVLADDPSLDARGVPVARAPVAVVLDARLRTPLDARVVRPGTVVVTTAGHPAAQRERFTAAGVVLLTVAAGASGGVALEAAMRTLADVGIRSVLAEPGLRLATALVRAGLVDRLVLHVATQLGGDEPRCAVPCPPGAGWRLERSGGAGPDLVLQYVADRARRAGPTTTREEAS